MQVVFHSLANMSTVFPSNLNDVILYQLIVCPVRPIESVKFGHWANLTSVVYDDLGEICKCGCSVYDFGTNDSSTCRDTVLSHRNTN